MLDGADKVIVALSGGSDSMALLGILCSLREKLNIEIEAAHVNHCLRGADSDNDESFVRQWCRENGIKLHTFRAQVAAVAEETGESVEEAGRRIRYDFFSKIAGDGKIATAHNLSDRIETFIFNFTRGAGLKGLCSIPPVRGNIIRPLIECSKEDIEYYCKSNEIPYVTDKTNADVAYSRNRIRHNVVSELKIINPSFEECALRCIDILNEDEACLNELAVEQLKKLKRPEGYDAAGIAALPMSLSNRVISLIIEKEAGINAEGSLIRQIKTAADSFALSGLGKTIQLPQNRFMRIRRGFIEFPQDVTPLDKELQLETGLNEFGLFTIELSFSNNNIDCSQNISNDFAVYNIDCDKIIGNLTARSRNASDALRIPKRNVTKSLRKLQNEKGISPELRLIAPVITDDEGIVAAYLCGVDERVAVTSQTENILRIIITEGRKADND